MECYYAIVMNLNLSTTNNTQITVNGIAMKEAIENFKKIAKATVEKVLDEKANQITDEAKAVASSKMKAKTGTLLAGINYKMKVTDKGIYATIRSGAKNKRIPKHPGKRNSNMKPSKYRGGVPYPRILEFSPRFGYKAGSYGRYAHLYPVADRVKDTVLPDIKRILLDEYRKVYKL